MESISKKPLIVVWFSCGAASAVAAKLTIEKYGSTHEVMVVNNPVKEEDPDNFRFLKDVQRWLGCDISFAYNPKFPNNSAREVWEKGKFMSSVRGADCTIKLKKEARYLFEKSHDILFHVMGFCLEEKIRHERFIKFERENLLPVLIEAGLTKSNCFDILTKAGIDLPNMYKKGYPNANCIGCVKATSPTYWNHVRIQDPEVFVDRATQSRQIGARLVRYKGQRIFLDELPEDAKGRKMKSAECSIFCETK